MESSVMPKIEKKGSIKPKFILNRFNGLLKTNKEVAENLTKGAHEMLDCDAQELRTEGLRLYKELVGGVLGEDFNINPEKDPFFKVTKTDIEKVYKEKHDIFEVKERDAILLPTTLLLSGEYFLEQDSVEGVRQEDGMHFNERVHSTKSIENGRCIDFQLFDPIKMNKERDWVMQFGFGSFEQLNTSGEPVKMIGEGAIILESGVVDAIRYSKESDNIAKKLQEILTWFNHDLTAHGTLLTGIDVDRKILEAGGKKIGSIFDNRKIMTDDSFSSAFAGELWSLNLHQSIFQEIVAERPAVLRYLRAHLDNYARSVELATNDISDKKVAGDVKDYLLKAYAFGFFRLVNPKDFHEKPEFESLRSKYPKLDELGIEESKVREFAFGEKGLIKIEGDNKSFIPHSEVFEEFVGSFEAAKRLQLLVKNLNASFQGDSSALLPSERNDLRKILEQYHYFELVKMLKDFKVNLSPLEKDGSNIYTYFNKDMKTVVRIMVEPNTTAQNFCEKVMQRIQ